MARHKASTPCVRFHKEEGGPADRQPEALVVGHGSQVFLRCVMSAALAKLDAIVRLACIGVVNSDEREPIVDYARVAAGQRQCLSRFRLDTLAGQVPAICGGQPTDVISRKATRHGDSSHERDSQTTHGP